MQALWNGVGMTELQKECASKALSLIQPEILERISTGDCTQEQLRATRKWYMLTVGLIEAQTLASECRRVKYNPDTERQRKKIYRQKVKSLPTYRERVGYVQPLTDSYIKELLKVPDAPQEIIELKRLHIQTKRYYKSIKHKA